jgi:predicted TIM-barrel fold metal-dependent hydrolase
VDKIALEEAVVIPGEVNLVPDHLTHHEFSDAYRQLLDLTGERLREMDANGIAVSVISVTSPGLQGLIPDLDAAKVARQWNDYLAESTAVNADRVKCFAALPMRDPDAAIAEMQRAVRELGFLGALVNGYDDGGSGGLRYYDAPEYLPFWHAAEELGMPIYIHPRSAPAGRETTYGDYPELRGSTWGFHIETAEHMLRLILSGLFDKTPDLQVVLGHLGEMLPWWCWRIDHRIVREDWQNNPATADRRLQHSVSDYLRRNFLITTSGYFETSALTHTLSVMGPDRVLFSVDYPYESCEEAATWFESLDLPADVHRKIAYDNAARLLKLA